MLAESYLMYLRSACDVIAAIIHSFCIEKKKKGQVSNESFNVLAANFASIAVLRPRLRPACSSESVVASAQRCCVRGSGLMPESTGPF